MAKRRLLQLLKLIGLALFIWILSRIDRGEVLAIIRGTHPLLLLSVIVTPFFIYAVRTMRWHILVRCAGHPATIGQSWRLYNIGVFLAIITPAKLGELGRAAYLRREGMRIGTALALVVMNRIADMVTIAGAGIVALATLYGEQVALLAAMGGVAAGAAGFLLWKKAYPLRQQEWLSFLPVFLAPKPLALTLLWTLIGWCIYFVWAALLAYGIGMELDPTILLSALILTGILAMVPVAPSGLGTRDAALLFFLLPYGVRSEQVVSLALLLFLSIVLSGGLGGWYWMKGVYASSAPQA